MGKKRPPHGKNKPWKEMALLLGWTERVEADWYVKVWGGEPSLRKTLRNAKYRDVTLNGPRRWQHAVECSRRRIAASLKG
jgi:hypothetical protein